MWIIDFCARRSSDCAQQAEACDDAERKQAWLHLAKEWSEVAEVVACKKPGFIPLGDQAP